MDTAKSSHRVLMEGRHKVEVTGVQDLLVFDETEVIMETSEGMLSIRGADLHMSNLNLEQGLIGLAGSITDLLYDESGEAEKNNLGLIDRLFRSRNR